ncbi:hypothetical protein FQN49_001023 [Arthroderma sp. PD_2]|nr:hypothetical protein FQN49_001023 [Arthroderma sp. PD_2]
MRFTVGIISLLAANVASVMAAPEQTARSLLSRSQIREGEASGFLPAPKMSRRGYSDGYHNFCDYPCEGHICVTGANPQCCVSNNVCGCCWPEDDPAYVAQTKGSDTASRKGGVNSKSKTKGSDRASKQRRPPVQHRVGKH